MKRRKFLQATATGAAGWFLMPQFLTAPRLSLQTTQEGDEVLVFLQLNGGNDGLNTFVPYTDPSYYHYRAKIGIPKDEIINPINGLGFHPALKNLATISQQGHLSIIQNVGYPNPNRSHFRSQEIWQTASDSQQYLDYGWLGRFLDLQCDDKTLASLNIDTVDNLALKAQKATSLTVKDFNKIKRYNTAESALTLSNNPQLDFVRKMQFASMEGMEEINSALQQAQRYREPYASNPLAKNMEWIAKLIKGGLHSKVYYTSLNGFDTHNNQLALHQKQLSILNDAVFSFYKDMKTNNLLHRVTVVIFSEFGRRVQENGTGTDHGTAGPMIIIGGNTKGNVLGANPNLSELVQGDLLFKTDFRSVYATLLTHKFHFDPSQIQIKNELLTGLF